MVNLIEQTNVAGNGESRLPAIQPTQTLSVAESSRKIAEVQAALTVAAARPRDTIAAMDRITNACGRIRLAESAVYEYGRGGTNIKGPSIRLLECIAGAWGNLEFGFRELSQGHGESTVEAFAWDLETNNKATKTFVVPHKIGLKGGRTKPLTDPRDVYEWVANQAQRRVRACLENIIPRDVIEEAVDQCDQTLRANGDNSPEGLKKLVDAFAKFGVTKEQIEARIQRHLDAIQPGQLAQLRRVYTSLKDGMSVASNYFDDVAEKAGSEPASDLKQKLQTKSQRPKKAPPKQSEPPAEDEGAISPGDLSFDRWTKTIEGHAEGESESLTEYLAAIDSDTDLSKQQKAKLAKLISGKTGSK